MSNPAANAIRPPAVAAVICAGAALAVFVWFGNASRGYVNTPSLFWWWISQWLDPAADSEHGWLILGLSAWLFWRNLGIFDFRFSIFDSQSSAAPRNAAGEQGAGCREQGLGARDQGPETKDQRPTAEDERTMGADNAKLETRNPKPQERNSKPETLNLAAPAAAMLGGLAVHAIGFAAQQARLSILALLLFAWGVLRLAGGPRWGRAAAFPLAFLVFAIPVNVLDTLGFWLRMGVVDASAAIAHAAGINVVQSGTQLFAPDGRYNYDVAAACSGIRSLTAMVALSLLAGYLNFASSWRRAGALLISFPLVYAGNIARIVAIIFAAQLGGPRWGDLAHEVMGFGVFVIVLGGVLAAIALLRRWWPEDGGQKPEAGRRTPEGRRRMEEGRAQRTAGGGQAPDAGRQPADGRERRTDDGGRMTEGGQRSDPGRWLSAHPAHVVVSVVLVLSVAEMAFLHHLANSPARGEVGVALAADGQDPVELPAFLGTEWIGRRAEVSAIEREILPPDTGFSRKLYVPIADGNRPVLLSIVLSGRDRTSIHRPELCLVGQGWTISGTGEHRFRVPGKTGATFPATVLRVNREVPTARGHVTVPQLTVYWFIGGDGVVPSHWQRVVRDSWNRVVHARADRWAYVLMQTDAADGEEAALTRMQAVLNQTLQVFAPQKPKI